MTDFTYPTRMPGASGRRLGSRSWPLYAGLAVAAAVFGIGATFHPPLVVAAALGLALFPVVLARPIVGLCALILFSFLETYAAMTGALSLTKILGAVLVMAWLAAVATRSGSPRGETGFLGREPTLAASLILLVAWAAMSVAWAEAPAEAQSSVSRFALNFVLFPIALLAIRSPRHAVWAVAVFVVGAFAAVGFGVVDGTIDDPETGGRVKGAGLNPNQLGSYLGVAAILAAVLVADRHRSVLARTAMLAVAGTAAFSVLLTLSRGALIGVGAAMIVAPAVIGRGRRLGALLVVVAAVTAGGAWYATVAPPEAADRLVHPERGGGSGRTDLWRVGWRMVEDEPIRGVGAGNFPVSSIHYLLRPGVTQQDAQIVDDRKVAHNIYLTVLSELGAVGLMLFAIVVLVCLRCSIAAASRFAGDDRIGLELLARGLFLALVSMLVAGFFSSSLYSKQLWFLLALAPALLALAERPSSGRGDAVTAFARPPRARARVDA